jgi:hypothetical protein
MGMSELQDTIVLCYIIYIKQSLLMAISFSVVTSPIEHDGGELLELHYDYKEKTVHLNAHECLLGEQDYKLKN